MFPESPSVGFFEVLLGKKCQIRKLSGQIHIRKLGGHPKIGFNFEQQNNMFSIRGPLSYEPYPGPRCRKIYLPRMTAPEMSLAYFIYETGCDLGRFRPAFTSFCEDFVFRNRDPETCLVWFKDIACGEACLRILAKYALKAPITISEHCRLVDVYAAFFLRCNGIQSFPLNVQRWMRINGFEDLARSTLGDLEYKIGLGRVLSTSP